VGDEWGIRRTKRFILSQIQELPWRIGKISRSRTGDYHVLFLNPSRRMDGHQTIVSAIKAIHELQKGFVERFGNPSSDKPKPTVASFVISPSESPQYAFRMNIILPPWAFPSYAKIYGPRCVKEEHIAKSMARKEATLWVKQLAIPVAVFTKSDLRAKQPIEQTIQEKNIPVHVIGGNLHETAGMVALLSENRDWRFGRNVYITVPGGAHTHWKKTFGQVVTEFDGIATNGKNVHVIEVKSVGPRTIPRWEEIVTHKAQTLTPGMEYISQVLGPSRTRMYPHFVVVGNQEHLAINLANRALVALKPHETFAHLMAHAVWPSRNALLKRSFREPWW